MKFLPARPLRAIAVAAAVLALGIGAASLPWHGSRAAVPPRVVTSARCSGPLSAGAAEVPFELPAGVPIGGYARLSYASEGSPGPVGARALVVSSSGCKVALASAEILLVPEALEAAVLSRVADLGLTGVVLAATHTHAGPGGYWEHAIGERIATGPYDPKVRDAIVNAVATAIRAAAGKLAPARAAVARGSANDLVRSRSGGAEDGPLTVVRLDRPDGTAVAEVTVFAAHPTILGTENRSLSGDWPGRFVAKGTHGVRLLFQGAIGDQSVEGARATGPEPYAAALSERVDALRFGAPDPTAPVAFASAEVVLPAPEPGAAPAPLRRAAGNLAFRSVPAAARVQAVGIGPALLLAVPAEPVARVAMAWREALPAGATIVSLADGYLGYVEAPERMAEGAGESVRTYYGPELAARLGEAVRAAAIAAAR